MKILFFIVFLLTPGVLHAGPSISPLLYAHRYEAVRKVAEAAHAANTRFVPVTVRFTGTPNSSLIRACEDHGLVFKRYEGRLLHSENIYPATIDIHNLEYFEQSESLLRIETTHTLSGITPLYVSNPQVQASKVWSGLSSDTNIDGSGVIVADVDTSIDIFHPGLFKPDGGTFAWLDNNANGVFDPGVDGVDLNRNGIFDSDESLNFYDADVSDPLDILTYGEGEYDLDFDWLYNDANQSGTREYGPDAGFTETDPCLGERVFIAGDENGNGTLDVHETVTALGTSRIVSIIDGKGVHHRGQDLFAHELYDEYHATSVAGILCGQTPGRRLTGMAPGAEIIFIDHTTANVEESILIARELGADIFMYEIVYITLLPHDGTSNLEVLISDLHKENLPQLTAAGNSADGNKHAFVQFQGQREEKIDITIPDAGITSYHITALWTSQSFDPKITLVIDENNAIDITGDTGGGSAGDIDVFFGRETTPKGTTGVGIIIASENSFSGDMSLLIQNPDPSVAADVDLFTHDCLNDWVSGVQFRNFISSDGTVCTPGTAEHCITVGAYDPRGTYGEQGAINNFSSRGKTIDGRRAVDIAAPGSVVYSFTIRSDSFQPGGYRAFGGTSAALPHVTGCVALARQLMPDMTTAELEHMLYTYAATDEFTGPVPNDTWGYGKLRIFDALALSGIVTQVDDGVRPESFQVSESYPNPFNSSVRFDVSAPAGTESLRVAVYNVLGQKVYGTTMELDHMQNMSFDWNGTSGSHENLTSGVYFFRFIAGNGGHETSVCKRALFLK